MCEISIIIVNYNSSELLANLIRSIKKYVLNISYEIIVVDNRSDQYNRLSLKSLEQFAEVKVFKLDNNVGFAAANNFGVKYAQGDYILLLNPDTIFIENSLEKIKVFREKNKNQCIIGIKLLNKDFSYQESRHTYPNPFDYFCDAIFLNKVIKNSQTFNRINYNWTDPDTITIVDSIKGALIFLDREVYIKLNGLDEQYFMFSEEMDLCYRAKRMGINTYFFPETSIIHIGGGTTCTNLDGKIRRNIELNKSMLIFVSKYHQFIYTMTFKVVLIIASMIRIIINYLLAIVFGNRTYSEIGKVYCYTLLWLVTNYMPEKYKSKK